MASLFDLASYFYGEFEKKKMFYYFPEPKNISPLTKKNTISDFWTSSKFESWPGIGIWDMHIIVIETSCDV